MTLSHRINWPNGNDQTTNYPRVQGSCIKQNLVLKITPRWQKHQSSQITIIWSSILIKHAATNSKRSDIFSKFRLYQITQNRHDRNYNSRQVYRKISNRLWEVELPRINFIFQKYIYKYFFWYSKKELQNSNSVGKESHSSEQRTSAH